MAEVRVADLGVEQGGCGCPDLGTDLLGSGSVGHALRIGDVGHDIAHWGGVWAGSTTGWPAG